MQLSPKKLYAGLYRGFRSLDRSNIESISWTKGHVLDTVPLDKVPAEQRRDAFGNHFADRAADEGVSLHPAIPRADREKADALVVFLTQLYTLVGDLLPLWPRLMGLERPRRGPRAPRLPALHIDHDWVRAATG